MAAFLQAARIQGFQVAAGFSPFVVLLRQDSADEPDDRVAGGEDSPDIGPAPYFFIRALITAHKPTR
jgi:hypothetical protein